MTTIARHLADLADSINREHAACEKAARSALSHAIRAGELLIEAKGQLAHGEWMPWLRDNFHGSPRSAQTYMRVARHRDELEAKAQGTAGLSLEDASRMLAAPAGPRDTGRDDSGCRAPEDVAPDMRQYVTAQQQIHQLEARQHAERLEYAAVLAASPKDADARRRADKLRADCQSIINCGARVGDYAAIRNATLVLERLDDRGTT